MRRAIRSGIVFILVILLVEFPRQGTAVRQDTQYLINQFLNPLLNQPAHASYFHWHDYMNNLRLLWFHLRTLNLGNSSVDGHPILQDVTDSFTSTLALLSIALAFTVLLGTTKGIYDGARSQTNSVGTAASGMLQWLIESIPDMFWILAVELFGFFLNRHGIQVYFVGSHDFATGTLVPALILCLMPTMYLSRLVRRVVEEQHDQQYLVTARAKGLSRGRILFRHLLPNVLPHFLKSLVPVIALLFGNLVLVEYLFYRHGVVMGLLNAMDYAHYIGVNFPYAASSFDPLLYLSYLAGAALVFLVVWIFIRGGVFTFYRRTGQLTPYSDRLREGASKSRIPWTLTLGIALLLGLMTCGAIAKHLPLPNPDTWQAIQFLSNGGLASPPFPPSSQHWLGTDSFGRDLLSGAVYGILPTLKYVSLISLVIVILSTTMAVFSSVWRRPFLRQLVNTWNTCFTVLPGVIAALLILEIPAVYWFGGHVANSDRVYWDDSRIWVFLAVLCLVETGRTAFVLQNQLDALEHKSYIEAAHVCGNARWTRFLIHHLRPLIFAVSEMFVIQVSRVLMIMVTLGFFGNALSEEFWKVEGGWMVVPTSHDWGGVIAQDARDFLGVPWVFFAPVLFVTLTVIALNLILAGIRSVTQRMPVSTSSRRWSTLGLVAVFARRKAANPESLTAQSAVDIWQN